MVIFCNFLKKVLIIEGLQLSYKESSRFLLTGVSERPFKIQRNKERTADSVVF